MRRTDKGLEIKVGLFVLIALLALAYLSLQLGEEKISTKKTYPLKAVFENVSGLVEGARVEMAGVEIGRVSRISLTDGKALVEMRIYEGVKIAKDAVAMVRTKGVLGDRYVEIRQGRSPEYLPPGAMIAKTISPVDLDQILAEVGPAIQNLREITAGLKELLGSEEGLNNFRQMVANIKDAAAAFKEVGERLAKGEGTIGKLLTDETLYVKIERLAANLSDVAAKLNRGEGTLGKLINDDELYADLKQTISTINQASSTLSEVAKKIGQGEGTLGKLISDEELYNKLNATFDSLSKIAQKIERGEGTLGRLINDDSLYLEAKKTLRNVNQAATGLQEQVPVTILGTIGTMVLQ
ncbi:MAG: MCE family protein [Thermodesulfobacteria bacterium]|nr:MCE family protein [Thermodesulfobacteriota bacterium]